MLMDRAAAQRARETGVAVPRLTEADYLLGVSDESRGGALRFATEPRGPFVAVPSGDDVPPVVDLPALLNASDEIAEHDGGAAALRLLLAPGSSLGGARPKTSVRDHDGQLVIAKFPSRTDRVSSVLWESVALTLAEHSGLRVEQHSDRTCGGPAGPGGTAVRPRPFAARAIPLRHGHAGRERQRVPQLPGDRGCDPAAWGSGRRGSARLWAMDRLHDSHSSNTDDHLRNHGFLYDGATRGWRLAPLYDVNPTLRLVRPGILTLAIDESNTTADPTSYLMRPPTLTSTNVRRDILPARSALPFIKWADQARAVGLSGHEINETSFPRSRDRAPAEPRE